MSDPGLFPGIVLCVLLGTLGAVLVFATERRHTQAVFQVRMLLLALALRFGLSVVTYQFGLVNVLGDEDGSGWAGGVALAENWHQRGISLFELPFVMAGAFEGHHRGYFYLLGWLFYVTGSPYRLVAAALNCFFGALLVVLAYRTARSLFGDGVAAKVAWWTCLFPSLIVWSALTVKEPVVILLETVALYGCIRLRTQGFALSYLALCAAAMLLLVPLRFYAIYIVAGAVLLSLVAYSLREARSAVASAVLGGIVVTALLTTGVFARHEATFERFDLERVQHFREAVSSGGRGTGSGVQQDYDVTTSRGLGMGLAVGAAHLLLAPFPWQLGGASLRMALTLPELLVWWYLFFLGLIPGLLYCMRQRFLEVSPLLLVIAGFGLLYSLMFGNVGLVFRQRAQLLPWLLVFAAVGLERRKLQRQELRARAPDIPEPAFYLDRRAATGSAR